MPYDYGALEPAMSGQILELHHSKHHAAYVKGSNDTLDQLAEARDKGDYAGLVGRHQGRAGLRLGCLVRTQTGQSMDELVQELSLLIAEAG